VLNERRGSQGSGVGQLAIDTVIQYTIQLTPREHPKQKFQFK
jgi:hypothetical protein